MPKRRITSMFVFVGSVSLSVIAACTMSDPETSIAYSSQTFKDVGAACAFGSQCDSQVCSADVPSGGCGVCLDARKLGERCDGPLQGCSNSAICQDGVCQSTKKGLGESCKLGAKGDDGHECDDELYCARTNGWESPGTCMAYTPVGGACGGPLTTRCVPGAYCELVGPSGTCAIPPANSCKLTQCAAGLFCHKYSTCLPATLPLGAPCGIIDGSFVDNDCELGTVCGNLEFPQGGAAPGTIHTCVPLPTAGELCMGYHCAEGTFCSEQTTDSSGVVPKLCEPLRTEGEACSTSYVFNKDCAAGLECRKEVCERACQ